MTGETPAETLASPPVSENAGASADHVSAQIMSASTQHKPTDTDSVAVHGHGAEGFWALAIGSIGVVFGDIGTSPLYAMKEALIYARQHGVSPELQITGLISLVFWALIMIVTVKYVIFLMRADNKGEGGTLALMALAQKALGKYSPTVFFLGICGAALFYGDGIITPGRFGAGRGRRPEGRTGNRPFDVLSDRADLGRHPAGPVHGPVEGHGQCGALLRTDHGHLVPDAGRARSFPHL